jgi:hypothetical protein
LGIGVLVHISLEVNCLKELVDVRRALLIREFGSRVCLYSGLFLFKVYEFSVKSFDSSIFSDQILLMGGVSGILFKGLLIVKVKEYKVSSSLLFYTLLPGND